MANRGWWGSATVAPGGLVSPGMKVAAEERWALPNRFAERHGDGGGRSFGQERKRD
jgi:hypothetical protein